MTVISHVYKLDFPNGKSYIGVSVDPVKRLRKHANNTSLVGNAIRRHGRSELKVLLIGEPQYCFEMEEKLTGVYGTVNPSGYNLNQGGRGGVSPSTTTLQRLSKAAKKRGMPRHVIEAARVANLNMDHPPLTESHKKKISDAMKRRPPMSLATKEKISRIRKRWWADRKAGGH